MWASWSSVIASQPSQLDSSAFVHHQQAVLDAENKDRSELYRLEAQRRSISADEVALGYYLAPQAYAQMQVLQQAVEATKSLDDDKLADHIRSNTFKTVLGDVKFGKGGEWAEGRMLQVQYHDIKSTDLEQFRGMDTIKILGPNQFKTGEMLSPYQEARK